MYICDFSRSVGAGSATRRKTRELTRSVIALIVPPLPAASRPSNTMITRRPLCFTHSCSTQSSAWSLRRCRRYSLSFIFFGRSFFAFFAMVRSLSRLVARLRVVAAGVRRRVRVGGRRGGRGVRRSARHLSKDLLGHALDRDVEHRREEQSEDRIAEHAEEHGRADRLTARGARAG